MHADAHGFVPFPGGMAETQGIRVFRILQTPEMAACDNGQRGGASVRARSPSCRKTNAFVSFQPFKRYSVSSPFSICRHVFFLIFGNKAGRFPFRGHTTLILTETEPKKRRDAFLFFAIFFIFSYFFIINAYKQRITML